MGDVYLAEQEEPIRRRVAIKVVKPGMDSRAILTRFRHERQTLTMLEHAGIARVYDAGSTERGLPYFVMEFVDGEPLNEYCQKHGVELEGRLAIFREVCAAVQHAHQKGVIHRDLKPSNVLVHEQAGRPIVKIIDFGIAKALVDQGDEASLATRAGQFIGTPEYMAPEQASGAADVRSDVFSLGVMLYQLVTGTLPMNRDQLRRMTGRELSEYISKSTPRKPSTVVAERRREGQGGPADRAAPPALGATPRELDWIIMRCLEPVPGRRYASVAALSDDLGRMLRHEPVEAGPPSRLYKASKFVRRNRGGVIAASAVVLAMIGGTVAASVGFVRARESQQRSDQAAQHAQKVSDFLERMLLSLKPERSQGMDTTLLRIMVDDAEAMIDKELAEVPVAEADIRLTLARIRAATGEWDQCLVHSERALELYEEIHGPEHRDTIAALDWVAQAAESQGEYERALAMAREAAQRAERVYGPDDTITLTTQGNYGALLVNRMMLDEAERVLTGAYDRRAALYGDESPDALSTLSTLASLRREQYRFEEALTLRERLLETRVRLDGEKHPFTILEMSNVATVLIDMERYEAAEPIVLRAIELSEEVNGEDHPFTLSSLNNLASIYKATGRVEEAYTTLCRACEGIDRRHGKDSFESIVGHRNLGEVLGMLGRLEEAEAVMRDVCERSSRLLTPEHPMNAVAPTVLAMTLARQGRMQDAYAVLTDAWDLISTAAPPGNGARGQVLRGLVFISERIGKPEEHARWRELFVEATGESQTPEERLNRQPPPG